MSQAAAPSLAPDVSSLERPVTQLSDAQPSVLDNLLAAMRHAVVLAGEQQPIE